jgi:hypothetical protein
MERQLYSNISYIMHNKSTRSYSWILDTHYRTAIEFHFVCAWTPFTSGKNIKILRCLINKSSNPPPMSDTWRQYYSIFIAPGYFYKTPQDKISQDKTKAWKRPNHKTDQIKKVPVVVSPKPQSVPSLKMFQIQKVLNRKTSHIQNIPSFKTSQIPWISRQ